MLFIAILTLFSGLSLSLVAAYYSVIGIAEFFSSAFYEVVIMAAFLELAKIVAALWLHKNWKNSPRKIRYYLLFSVMVLMFITSLGIFGFLSKSHIAKFEQTNLVNERISLLENQKLLLERQKELYQNNLQILDAEIQRLQQLNRITQSIQVRQNQTRQREEYILRIREIESKIFEITNNVSDLRSQNIQIDTKLGPLKYFISTIEMFTNKKLSDMYASQIFIIMIIFVFDPVAICLLIASQWSFMTYFNRREQKLGIVENISKEKENTSFFFGKETLQPYNKVIFEEGRYFEPKKITIKDFSMIRKLSSEGKIGNSEPVFFNIDFSFYDKKINKNPEKNFSENLKQEQDFETDENSKTFYFNEQITIESKDNKDIIKIEGDHEKKETSITIENILEDLKKLTPKIEKDLFIEKHDKKIQQQNQNFDEKDSFFQTRKKSIDEVVEVKRTKSGIWLKNKFIK